ncbi:sce7726 family protein [Photobacterium damselae]|uniref:sce7726 family protein n=1 Tax=Photobacterium damselae TaxID=38293 RepID=UPI000D9F6F18|nr:sce7726 family protein [Photobacterium damselae]NVO75039.1 sce7726 family protein [Photobacterium damselae subsp. damselae]SPY25284.1 Uncharacterised protein [Photobacterium damselae]
MKKRNLEPQIKLSTINYLIEKKIINDDNTIINEFNVGGYKRRVDLSIATNKYLYAFEIKSEYDSLYRLNGQIETYLNHFDKVFIVTTKKYIDKVLLTTPPNVAVWEFDNGIISIVRKGKIKKINNKETMLNMMNIDELKQLVKNSNIKSKDNKRKTLVELSLNIPIYRIKEHMIKSIKNRYLSTNKVFLEKANTNKLNTNDLKLLSTKRKDNIYIKTALKTTHNEDISNYIKALNFI